MGNYSWTSYVNNCLPSMARQSPLPYSVYATLQHTQNAAEFVLFQRKQRAGNHTEVASVRWCSFNGYLILAWGSSPFYITVFSHHVCGISTSFPSANSLNLHKIPSTEVRRRGAVIFFLVLAHRYAMVFRILLNSFMRSRAAGWVHPILMFLIVPGWFFTFLLGWQARRRRLNFSPEREALITAPVSNKRHHKLSAALAFLTAFAMFFALLVNYIQNGVLYPGTHLYGGFVFLLLMSANIALVPWFKDTHKLRILHITIGLALLVTAVSQVISGIPILQYL